MRLLSRSVLPILVAAGLWAPASSGAATTLGQLFAPDAACIGPRSTLQTGAASGAGYSVPAAGVLTSWAFETGSAVPPGLAPLIARPTTLAGTFTAVAVHPAATAPGANGINTYTLRPGIAVRPGDVLGIEKDAGGGICQLNSGSSTDTTGAINSTLSPGASAAFSSFGNSKVQVSASLEPDIDGDGLGDQTQDSCPHDPAIHTGPCFVNVSLEQRIVPRAGAVGSYAVLSVTAQNHSATDPAHDAAVIERLPSGLGFVAGIGPNGPCTTTGGATVTCSLGDIPTGTSIPVELIVKVRRAGSSAIIGRVTSQADNVTANDSVTTRITGRAVYCTVPRLTGLTTTAAKKRLAKAGCKLGKVTRKGSRRKSRKVVVTSQSVPARIRVAPGTAIAVTIRSR